MIFAVILFCVGTTCEPIVYESAYTTMEQCISDSVIRREHTYNEMSHVEGLYISFKCVDFGEPT